MAGLFLFAMLRDYFETRSLESEVPIELNTDTIWLADVRMEKLPGPLAQYCRTVDVGSPGAGVHLDRIDRTLDR